MPQNKYFKHDGVELHFDGQAHVNSQKGQLIGDSISASLASNKPTIIIGDE